MEADATVNMGEKGVMKHFPQESVISEAHRPVLCNNKSPAILALRLSVLRFCYYSFLFSLQVAVYANTIAVENFPSYRISSLFISVIKKL